MAAYGYEGQRSGRAPRRRHPLRTLLIVLLVLLALLVAADRVGVVIADHVAASRIQQDENLSTKPSVSIKGFPFLTQVAAMDFDHVTASESQVESNGLTVTDVQVDLRGVRPQSGFDSARVDTLHATALLSYSQLESYAASHLNQHVTISQGPAGQLTVKGTFLGVPATAYAKLTVVSGNVIDVTGTKLATPIPGAGSIDIARLINFQLQLGDLPFGFHINSADTTSQGITVASDSTNTTLDAG